MSEYVVFAVDTADRMTLLCPPTGPEPQFKQVLLSFLTCPKLARRAGTEMTPDEPCGYDAMEFTRSQVIGKVVKFTEDYNIDAIQRTSGRMVLKTGNVDISVALLKAGFASVPERCPAKCPKELFEQYTNYMNAAKASKLGMWSANAKAKVRNVKPFPPANPEALAKSLQGKEVKVRIDRIQSGHNLYVTTLNDHQMVQVNLTGIQCPNSRETAAGAQAKFFTEKLLLNRQVPMRFEGIDSFGNFLASVVSPKGTFQEELLKKGLGKIQPATVSQCGARDALRAAEGEAQAARAGLWKDAADKSTASAPVTVSGGAAPTQGEATSSNAAAGPAPVEYKGVRDFTAVVTQVINGDTIVVKNTDNGEYVRVQLCGVRASKSMKRDTEAGKQHETRVSYSEYSWEAREFLRTKFLGMEVRVHVEYARQMDNEAKEIRPVATVTDEDTGVNVGAALIMQGLAKFFVGKTDVCSCADELMDAEAAAKSRGLNIHSSKDAPVTKIVELNRLGESKAKYYLSFLQRGMQGNRAPVLKGIVENVTNGGSVRVYIPKEHFQFSLKLAGITAPATGFTGEAPDPFADESRDFLVSLIQQREADIQVETCDRAGNFIGTVTYRGKNVAVSLVEAGLATVSNADRLSFGPALQAAENTAREKKLYIWSDKGAVPQRQQKREQQLLRLRPDSFAKCTTAEAEWATVAVADVIDGNTLALNIESADNASIRQKVQTAVNKVVAQKEGPPSNLKKGEFVAAYYKEDKKWYRGKVTSVEGSYAEVLFLDFGTRSEVKISKEILEVPKTPEFAAIKDSPSLAVTAKLSFLRDMDVDHEFCDEACDYIWALVEEAPTVFGRCDYVDGHGNKYFTITASKTGPSFGDMLLAEGLAVVNKNAVSVDAESAKRATSHQEVARTKHRRMWQYGDVGEDDEKDY